MSAPDPESLSFAAKILAGVGTIGGVIAGPIVWIHGKLEKKADKEEVNRCLEHIEKLYQNAEDDRRLTRDLHDKAMEQIRDNQVSIIEAIRR